VAPTVRILPDALVNQIAAGEVVERPASVVKELLENAIDAGARHITVAIGAGGVERLRVTDDGHGMSAANAALAVERHATSKISCLDDLSRIGSLGFRGEALPSIASVARFRMVTRTADSIEGTSVVIEGGSGIDIRGAGCAPGTSVEVRDLFFNVPARRKFLKSTATENAHVLDACLRTALAQPSLRLILERDGRTAREYLPAADRAARARAVLGPDPLEEVAAERDGVRVLALLGPPDRARAGASGLHLFVNGRPVRDRALARAVAFAYGSVLPPGRFPSGAVFLELPPGEVDVNVHPQKWEVRFARGRAVLDAVTRALATGLGTTAWGGPAARGSGWWTGRLGSAPSPERGAGASSPTPDAEGERADPWGLAGAMRDGGAEYRPTAQSASALPAGAAQAELPNAPGPFGSLQVLGQARRMLIVCEAPDALVVIDQHAADERVRYHALRSTYDKREVATQRLLFPARVEVDDAAAALVAERHAELLAVGLDCVPVGPTTVAVHAVPAIVGRAPAERLLRDVLDQLALRGDRAFGDAIDTALATMACHGAVRAGDELSRDECRTLLRALDGVGDFAGHCPHGRPVVLRMPFHDIDRRLGR